jgi:hypothetical protein
MGYELLVTGEANQSLERIGEQLVMMERTVPFETEVINQPTVPSTRLALS